MGIQVKHRKESSERAFLPHRRRSDGERENLMITPDKVRGGINQHTRGEALEKLYCEYITNQA